MTLEFKKSKTAFERARKVLVGGVDSPVRSFAAVGGVPPFIAKAKGSRIVDVDGNEYVDYVGSYGPLILGHAHERVMTAITKAVHLGTSFGAPTVGEYKLAEAIAAAMPSIQKVRFVSSGTEAVMTAVRLARGATGRSKFIKCIGGYHGHADALLVSAGSGATTLNVPSSPGVPPAVTADTLLAPYNDLAATAKLFDEHGKNIAAMLVEPVAGNMGVVPPAKEYLQGLRDLCTKHGALLIFDEVMTGFRVALGGAQALYNVQPDLTTLGKIIGGGMPVGAVGGRREIMDHLAPLGPVYQAGTLSGNPVAMAAGLAMLLELNVDGFYQRLEALSAELEQALRQAANAAGLEKKITLNRVGSMLTCFLAPPPVHDYAAATASNTAAFAAYFHAMLQGGVYLPPSQFEAIFVSSAHTSQDIQRTAEAAEKAFEAAAAKM
jgi:glutamate-1-semialdehyde 2,1-aminomutase